MAKFSVVATGDSMLVQRLAYNDPACLELKKLFSTADVRFTNFELQIHDFEVFPSAVSGGTWVAARPAVIDDLKWLGFNIFAAATNHTLDWGLDGLVTTMRHLNEKQCLYAGIGMNLAEASMPKYLDVPQGRVALISVCSTGPNWYIAGQARPDVLGRPGLNMLRFTTINYLPKEDLARLKAIVSKTNVNAKRLLSEQEGFDKPLPGFAVGTERFEEGTPGTKTFCNKEDLARIKAAIEEAKQQADIVLISHHAHEFGGTQKIIPADYIKEFAHFCIDAGVDAYLGHGPHILRGIEIYKEKPVFYSLGDFFIQNDSIERQPADFYAKYGLGAEATVAQGFAARSKNNTRGLMCDKLALESCLTKFVVEGHTIKEVELIPLSLGPDKPRSRRGRPEIADKEDGKRILAYLQELSKEFGTKIAIKAGKGKIKIK